MREGRARAFAEWVQDMDVQRERDKRMQNLVQEEMKLLRILRNWREQRAWVCMMRMQIRAELGGACPTQSRHIIAQGNTYEEALGGVVEPAQGLTDPEPAYVRSPTPYVSSEEEEEEEEATNKQEKDKSKCAL